MATLHYSVSRMLLYHFTAGENLRAIATEGLTIGDVPTDLARMKGRIGIWLTTSESPDGHGLSESAVDKKRFRLKVDVPDTPLLVRWSEWSLKNVTQLTRERLHSLAADGDANTEWWVCFGWIRPEQILSVLDMRTGDVVEKWGSSWAESESREGVPFRRRDAWHRRLLKDVKRELVARQLPR